VADWVTISSLATAGGTLVLAIATFGSVRSANRAARVAELSLLTGLRPVLITSREEDPPMRVGFGDRVVVIVPGHGAAIELRDGNLYMAVGLRNGGQGLAVLHAWRVSVAPVRPEDPNSSTLQEAPALDQFRRQLRDLYIPAGDIGFWQGAIRDRDDPDYRPICDAVEAGDRVLFDLLYGDHEGGQPTVSRFSLVPREGEPKAAYLPTVVRHWRL
jgi:hypothetical protein